MKLTCGPWLSLITNTEQYASAEKCFLCRHDVPHNQHEHDHAVKHGLVTARKSQEKPTKVNWKDRDSRLVYKRECYRRKRREQSVEYPA